jgi:K+-transporting ATPase ATPase C chain
MDNLPGTIFNPRERGPRDSGAEVQDRPSNQSSIHTVLRPAITLLIVMTAITGIAYPLAVTGVAKVLFPVQAAGSLIVKKGEPVGSWLIGQSYSDPKYFWSRPSATSPQPYNGVASGGSNLGPLNPALTEAVKARIALLRAADPSDRAPIPVDLVTASASGLDPDISLAAAYYQADRIARIRHLSLHQVRTLIAAHARHPWLGVLGDPRVNVLELNLALDGMK